MLAEIAICSTDPMAAVLAATSLRREGVSVTTQFSGKLSRQIERAYTLAAEVFVAEHGDLRRVHRGSLAALTEVFGAK